MGSEEAAIDDYDIAVIGIDGRFPGAPDPQTYWANLAAGVESLTHFSLEELAEAGVSPDLLANPRFVPAAPVLDEPGRFDARLFGYSAREAQLMDPQHRLLLEMSWGALENAGYDPQRYDGRIGVVAGTAMNTYLLACGLSENFSSDYLPVLLGSDKDFAATRVAYKLDLRGPAFTVQTACSTSLVAVHLACQALRDGDMDMALVGAAAVRVPAAGHIYQDASVFAPDGHCRPFDAAASGTTFGSGGGVVILKPLINAVEDHDHIWGVIKGSAINNDGSSKGDYTAPSVVTQAEAISEALGAAAVPASSISYVEAHGTGTYLGDPIEVAALTRAFANDDGDKQYCALGAVKANVGHLDAAAGMAAMIKVLKSFEHGQLAPSINYSEPNPQIDFPSTPFYVNTELRKWEPTGGSLRRAGITSLGMGGTNAHVVLEEPPIPSVAEHETTGRPHILLMSARSETALDRTTERLAGHLREESGPALADVAFTLRHGRRSFPHRRAIVLEDGEQSSEFFQKLPRTRATTGSASGGSFELAFAFPGGGSQYAGMGLNLHKSEPVYREAFDTGVEVIGDVLGIDLRVAVHPEPGGDLDLINTPEPLVTAMFVNGYAHAKMLIERGVVPQAMIGHSLGEYVAATVSGVFSYEDALFVVARRARLLASTDEGAMLAAATDEETVRGLLVDGADIGALNGQNAVVVSGGLQPVAEVERELTERGIESRRLRATRGYHSKQIDQIVDELTDVVASVERSAPTIPFPSNVTGDWITPEQATDPSYWGGHAATAVRFGEGLNLLAESGRALLEVGANQVLSAMARQNPAFRGVPVAATGRRPADEVDERVSNELALAKLWTAGVDIDWDKAVGDSGRRTPLPSYPFEGKVHWFTKQDRPAAAPRPEVPTQPPVRDAGSFGWKADWVPADRQPGESVIDLAILVDRHESFAGVAKALVAAGAETIDVGRDGLESVLEKPAVESRSVLVVDFGPASPEQLGPLELFDRSLDLVRTVGRRTQDISLVTVTADFLNGTGVPASAVALGPALVGTKEFNRLSCRVLATAAPLDASSASEIAAELLVGSDPVVVLQGETRLIRKVEKLPLDLAAPAASTGDVVVVTGGLSGLGLAIAEHLVESKAKVGLIGRRSPEEVGEISPTFSQRDDVATAVADVTDPGQLSDALDQIQAALGPIGMVVHSAGVIKDGLITNKDKAEAHEVLDVKVNGAKNLHDECVARNIPTLVNFSSINALLAPVGQVDYVAANSFLDQMAAAAEGDPRVVSIAWPGWRDVGLVSRMGDGAVKRTVATDGIDAAEGVRLFAGALASGQRHVLISPTELVVETAATSHEPPRVSAEHEPAPDIRTPEASGDLLESIRQGLAEIYGELLGEPNVAANDSFLELGGTSLLAVSLVTNIEQRWGTNLAVDVLLEADTVAALADLVAAEMPAERVAEAQAPAAQEAPSPAPTIERPAAAQPDGHRSLRRIRAGDGEPLFLVNGEGGNIVGLAPLASRLSAEYSVWGLRSAGLDGGEPDQTIKAMAQRYLAEIEDVWPQGPSILSGYCMGGVIAHEMARQLKESRGLTPTVLMIDVDTPQFHLRNPSKEHPIAVARYYGGEAAAKEAAERAKDRTGYARRRLSQALSRLSEAAASPLDQEGSGTAATLQAVAEANRSAFFDHVSGGYDGRVILVRPRRRLDDFAGDTNLGWSEVSPDLTVVNIANYRFQLWIEPGISGLANLIEAELRLAASLRRS